jgi:hypothetical protein
MSLFQLSVTTCEVDAIAPTPRLENRSLLLQTSSDLTYQPSQLPKQLTATLSLRQSQCACSVCFHLMKNDAEFSSCYTRIVCYLVVAYSFFEH